MSDSRFIAAFNQGNDAFSADCKESFQVIKNGRIGTYEAISIDDLKISSVVAPGGFKGENETILFVYNSVFAQAQITDGTMLIVRGKRVRVNDHNADGDNSTMLSCGGTGLSLK